MPILSCILPNGKKGFKFGLQGKCFASPEKAEAQGRAIKASQSKKKK